jgi:hypothetical protein
MPITDTIPYSWDLHGKTHPDSPQPKHLTHSEIRSITVRCAYPMTKTTETYLYHQSICTCGWTGHYKLQEIDALMDGDEHCITQALMEGR